MLQFYNQQLKKNSIDWWNEGKNWKFLIGSTTSEFLEKDIEILEKSLECRKSDIEKAENTSDEYFLKLLKDLEEAKKDVIPINYALKKIKEYSE